MYSNTYSKDHNHNFWLVMYAGLLQSSVRLNPVPFLQLTSSSRSADLPLSSQKPMDRNKSKICIYFYGTDKELELMNFSFSSLILKHSFYRGK